MTTPDNRMDVQQSLIQAIRRADRGEAQALLDNWAAVHGYEKLLREVLEPTLLRIGEEWRCQESFTLAQAYVAARIAEDVLAKLADTRSSSPPHPSQGPVVIGNIEEDFHALGRRMVGTFLRTDGWQVYDLGNDVTPATFVETALNLGARVIGVSAMMNTTARNIRRLREEIDRRGQTGRLQLAVGGAVFLVHPELIQEVGGDGTACSALEAAKLFQHLWHQSCAVEANDDE